MYYGGFHGSHRVIIWLWISWPLTSFTPRRESHVSEGNLYVTLCFQGVIIPEALFRRISFSRDFLIIQWLRPCPPSAGVPSSDPWSGTRISHATTKICCSQVNKNF